MQATHAEPGMSVTLVLLTTRPELNGTTATLVRYMRTRRMWAARLPDGSVFAVRAENMRTREMLAQQLFRLYGRPLVGQPSFADLVRVVHTQHGRALLATRDISKGTFAHDTKVHLTFTPAELAELQQDFETWREQTVARIMGVRVHFDFSHRLSHYSSRLSSYLGKFLLDGHSKTPLVQDLMDFDPFADGYLDEMLERLVLFDVIYFDFWRVQLHGRFSADCVWRAFTFLLSHAFLNDDHTLTLGTFLKAQCDDRRWDSYADEHAPPFDCLLGNIEDIPPWGVQSPVRPGEIPASECVLFSHDVRSGEPVTMDYGESYKLSRASQLRQFRHDEIRPLLEAVLEHVDPRVMCALDRHMLS